MGLFDRRRVELINGDILEMLPMNEPHAYAVQLGTYLLMRQLPPSHYTVRVQLPMRLGEMRPMPEFVVLAGSPRENNTHPISALLVIEISDASLTFDRTDKAELYAAFGITDYWIADLNAKRVDVHRKPLSDPSGVIVYSERYSVGHGATLTALNIPALTFSVEKLIP